MSKPVKSLAVEIEKLNDCLAVRIARMEAEAFYRAIRAEAQALRDHVHQARSREKQGKAGE